MLWKKQKWENTGNVKKQQSYRKRFSSHGALQERHLERADFVSWRELHRSQSSQDTGRFVSDFTAQPCMWAPVLQKHPAVSNMNICNTICVSWETSISLLLQDPHVNAFFHQCQKREKDMSQSPTSNFVRSCKVTWCTNSFGGLRSKNGQQRCFIFHWVANKEMFKYHINSESKALNFIISK